jgi:hypothetical protein
MWHFSDIQHDGRRLPQEELSHLYTYLIKTTDSQVTVDVLPRHCSQWVYFPGQETLPRDMKQTNQGLGCSSSLSK